MRDVIGKMVAALVLLLVLASPVFAGGEQEGAAAEDVTVIKWFGQRGVPSPDAEIVGLLESEISQRLGYEVRFELYGAVQDHQELLQLNLAAQELPDVFLYFGVDTDFTRQAVARFDIQEMFDNMPRMTSFLLELMADLGLDEEETWAKYQDEDGLMFGTPRIWDLGWIPSGQMWRQDILDELGYEIPSTIAEAEEVFAAYKEAYPDRYVLGASGRAPTWQAFDIVFNAFGIVNGAHGIQDGTVRQHFAYPEWRDALEVIARWYEAGYIDPEFVNHDNNEKFRRFAQGQYLVVEWINRNNWDFSRDAPNIGTLVDNVPGAVAVPARHLAAAEGQKPMQRVWNPFLNQIVAFGNHLTNDMEHMRKVMQVGDLISQDREIKYLAAYGVEGTHYTLEEGEEAPTPTDLVRGLSQADAIEQYGYGFYWDGVFSTYTPIPSNVQAAVEEHVLSPDGIYHQNQIDYWLGGSIISGAIRDESGEDIGALLAADSSLDPWVMSTRIILGQEPIEYYDEWLENWYANGGELWERHATRLYGP